VASGAGVVVTLLLLVLLLALLEGGDLGVEAGDDALPACGGVAGELVLGAAVG
jgi:hypothetical protein